MNRDPSASIADDATAPARRLPRTLSGDPLSSDIPDRAPPAVDKRSPQRRRHDARLESLGIHAGTFAAALCAVESYLGPVGSDDIATAVIEAAEYGLIGHGAADSIAFCCDRGLWLAVEMLVLRVASERGRK